MSVAVSERGGGQLRLLKDWGGHACMLGCLVDSREGRTRRSFGNCDVRVYFSVGITRQLGPQSQSHLASDVFHTPRRHCTNVSPPPSPLTRPHQSPNTPLSHFPECVHNKYLQVQPSAQCLSLLLAVQLHRSTIYVSLPPRHTLDNGHPVRVLEHMCNGIQAGRVCLSRTHFCLLPFPSLPDPAQGSSPLCSTPHASRSLTDAVFTSAICHLPYPAPPCPTLHITPLRPRPEQPPSQTQGAPPTVLLDPAAGSSFLALFTALSSVLSLPLPPTPTEGSTPLCGAPPASGIRNRYFRTRSAAGYPIPLTLPPRPSSAHHKSP